MELVQYGALLKPLMDTMEEAVEVLQRRDDKRVSKQAAASFKRSEIPTVRGALPMSRPFMARRWRHMSLARMLCTTVVQVDVVNMDDSKVDTGPTDEERRAAAQAKRVAAKQAQQSRVLGFDISDLPDAGAADSPGAGAGGGAVVEAKPLTPVKRRPSITSEKPWCVHAYGVGGVLRSSCNIWSSRVPPHFSTLPGNCANHAFRGTCWMNWKRRN